MPSTSRTAPTMMPTRFMFCSPWYELGVKRSSLPRAHVATSRRAPHPPVSQVLQAPDLSDIAARAWGCGPTDPTRRLAQHVFSQENTHHEQTPLPRLRSGRLPAQRLVHALPSPPGLLDRTMGLHAPGRRRGPGRAPLRPPRHRLVQLAGVSGRPACALPELPHDHLPARAGAPGRGPARLLAGAGQTPPVAEPARARPARPARCNPAAPALCLPPRPA